MAMEATPNRRSFVRLHAVRALLLGFSRAEVCVLCARSDRMVRLWIELFNRGGEHQSPPRTAAQSQTRARTRPARAGAGKSRHCGPGALDRRQIPRPPQGPTASGIWLQHHGSWLRELNFHLRVPHPWPERQNEVARQVFGEELHTLAADPTVELWFGDESGTEGDPRPYSNAS
jgi:hypothetical protein